MAYLCVLFVMHFKECINIKRPLYTYWIICKADVQIKYIKITRYCDPSNVFFLLSKEFILYLRFVEHCFVRMKMLGH